MSEGILISEDGQDITVQALMFCTGLLVLFGVMFVLTFAAIVGQAQIGSIGQTLNLLFLYCSIWWFSRGVLRSTRQYYIHVSKAVDTANMSDKE